MSVPASRTAAIVGAGIGGLAAGVALGRAGWQVRIHERAASPRELGFALALAPNALAALRELGLADTMIAEGVAATKAQIRRPDGRVIRTFSAQVGGPLVVALRQTLHGALLDAVGSDALVLGSAAVDVAPVGRSVSIELEGGRTDVADVLIGADGAGSVIRSRLHPREPQPRPSGYCALRGIAYGVGDHLGDLAAVGYLGDGVEAATARASENGVYWYVSLLAADVPAGVRDPKVLLDAHTPGFDSAFRAITAATRPDEMRFDELIQRDPLPEWGAGRVTLLGDAAHPMLPHTGQGAAQALEDAVALGLALAEHGDVEHALRRYERVRSRRTRRVVAMGPRIARFTTTRSVLVQALRTAMIRSIPEALLVSATSGRGRDPHRSLRSGGAR
jgi:2-polyprenyl-6-methoxyphenol hydroxylase-like FAD-dependent oxidoreductase